jgi:hypothetical protein
MICCDGKARYRWAKRSAAHWPRIVVERIDEWSGPASEDAGPDIIQAG